MGGDHGKGEGLMSLPGPPDDMIVAATIREIGVAVDASGELDACSGLTKADLIDYLFQCRYDIDAYAIGVDDVGNAQADDHYWDEATTLWKDPAPSDQPVTTDYQRPVDGYWHVTDEPLPDQVYASGRMYDIFMAAARFLEAWAAKVKLEFNFNDGSGTYNREAKYKALREHATLMRSQAQNVSADIIRSDTDQYQTVMP